MRPPAVPELPPPAQEERPLGAGLEADEGPSRCDIVTEAPRDPCILQLVTPQALWGPKRSGEFLAKKRHELSRLAVHATPERGTSMAASSRRPDEFLLYPPELHGHFLFNVLAHEAYAATIESDGSEQRLGVDGDGPFRRVLVFFNSTKSLQFHYALFKHYLFPNVGRLLEVAAVQEAADDGWAASGTSKAKGGGSSSSAARESSEFKVTGDEWPRGAPLPTLWALHSRLSLEKRRAVVEAFASDSTEILADGTLKPRGLKVLFCTDVAAVGVQLGSPALVLQVRELALTQANSLPSFAGAQVLAHARSALIAHRLELPRTLRSTCNGQRELRGRRFAVSAIHPLEGNTMHL